MNRERRRAQSRALKSTRPPSLANLEIAVLDYNEVVRARDLQPKVLGTARFYKPPNLTPTATAFIEISEALEGVRNAGLEDSPLYISTLETNYYDLKVRGTSLSDIAQMPLPLAPKDIGKINKMLRHGPFSKISFRDYQVIEALISLPVEELSQSKVKVSSKVATLNERLKGYFDHYSGYLSSSFVDEGDEAKALFALSWAMPYSLRGLIAYFPAKLGITPETAWNIYKDKMVNSVNSFSWSKLNSGFQLKDHFKGAIPQGTLPAELVSRVGGPSDRESDSLVAAFKRSRGDYKQQTDLLEETITYRKALRREILGLPEKVLVVEPAHPAIARIAIACHNDKATASYKDTFIIMTTLTDGTEFVVEVNNSDRVWGVDPMLVKYNPHAESVLARELLTPVLNHARAGLQPEKPMNAVHVIAPRQVEIVLEPENLPQVKNPKVKTRGIPFLSTLSTPEIPEAVSPESTRAAQVDYTRELIEGFLPNVKDQTVITRVMKTIDRFERTGQGIYQLEKEWTSDIDLYGLKCGDLRIILTRAQGINFEPQAVLNRSNYNNSNLRNLADSL